MPVLELICVKLQRCNFLILSISSGSIVQTITESLVIAPQVNVKSVPLHFKVQLYESSPLVAVPLEVEVSSYAGIVALMVIGGGETFSIVFHSGAEVAFLATKTCPAVPPEIGA